MDQGTKSKSKAWRDECAQAGISIIETGKALMACKKDFGVSHSDVSDPLLLLPEYPFDIGIGR